MSEWTQVGENLVRHRGGTIYLRAKVKGKVIRVSLETAELRVAKTARDDRLTALRTAAITKASTVNVRTLGDAIEVVASRMIQQPHLEKPTIQYYKAMAGILRDTMPVSIHARTWTAREAAGWWSRVAKRYAPQRANNVLSAGRRVGRLLVELGIRLDDPTAKLRRLKIPEKQVDVPSRERLAMIIGSIRSQNKSNSVESADYVEFLAYAGCRHGQAKAFEWEHDEGDWLKFPSGITGTKGAATRRLPVSAPLRAVLERVRARAVEELKNGGSAESVPSGPIFKIKTPRIALDNACKRLEVPHMRLQDLRHFFTVFAIESGVDIPTVARWLGHKDGGRLLMKTYSHLRDEHSLNSAKKLLP